MGVGGCVCNGSFRSCFGILWETGVSFCERCSVRESPVRCEQTDPESRRPWLNARLPETDPAPVTETAPVTVPSPA